MNTDLYDRFMALPAAYPGFKEIPADLAYLMGCRDFDQFKSTLLGLIVPDKHCPFCLYQAKESISPEDGHWYLRENDFPPDGVRAWLIVPVRHYTHPRELSGYDWEEIGELLLNAIETHNIEGGGLVLRFGDPHFHSGTIPHLHFNILAPTGEKEYKAALSKTDEGRRANYVRLMTYRAELLEKGGLDWLFSRD